MATKQVQDNLASETLASFDKPISVDTVSKLRKFPFLQELGFNGQLGYAKDQFHGLSDFNKQMDRYSSTSKSILTPAWLTIRQLVPINSEVAKNLFTSGTLGTVGSAFRRMTGFDKVFATGTDQLGTKL